MKRMVETATFLRDFGINRWKTYVRVRL